MRALLREDRAMKDSEEDDCKIDRENGDWRSKSRFFVINNGKWKYSFVALARFLIFSVGSGRIQSDHSTSQLAFSSGHAAHRTGW
mmetsp:Transcript_5059/g.11446  ORF Transcript_5059/g.11446 Transcript_5059/m.11446 type:complete len:85 (-) Transcript_5059:242-496(-)